MLLLANFSYTSVPMASLGRVVVVKDQLSYKQRVDQCTKCGERVTCASGMLSHAQNHSLRSLYKCAICGEEAKQKSTAMGHLLKVHPVECSTRDEAKRHLRDMADEQTHLDLTSLVSVCFPLRTDQRSASPSEEVDMSRHQFKSRVKKCRKCSTIVTRPWTMAQHAKRHWDTRHYRCAICTHTASQKDNLVTHLVRKHSEKCSTREQARQYVEDLSGEQTDVEVETLIDACFPFMGACAREERDEEMRRQTEKDNAKPAKKRRLLSPQEEEKEEARRQNRLEKMWDREWAKWMAEQEAEQAEREQREQAEQARLLAEQGQLAAEQEQDDDDWVDIGAPEEQDWVKIWV